MPDQPDPDALREELRPLVDLLPDNLLRIVVGVVRPLVWGHWPPPGLRRETEEEGS